MNFRVYTDETRPLLQGARLSAFEMQADGVDTTVICDNMASQVMKNGWVNAVFVGCDRVAANGDACNKIGTSGVAILAKYYGIPFYVLGPTSTIDMSIARGEDITIEQRPAEEVTEMWYKRRMAPEGVKVYNPAFDFADNELIAGIVTEYGIAARPTTRASRRSSKRRPRPKPPRRSKKLCRGIRPGHPPEGRGVMNEKELRAAVQRLVLCELARTGQHCVPVMSSNRHVHLCQADVEKLFGAGYQLTKMRDLVQPASSPVTSA